MALVMGIDPGSVSGVVVFDTETKAISMIEELEATHRNYDDKIRWLARGLFECIDLYKAGEGSALSCICIETFVMRGKGGQQLQKLIGAYVSVTPEGVPVYHVANTSVKKVVGSRGDAGKEKVAMGVANYFHSNKESVAKIMKLIEKEKWDLTDAFAIGIAGRNYGEKFKSV